MIPASPDRSVRSHTARIEAFSDTSWVNPSRRALEEAGDFRASSLYASPRTVSSLEDCYFYHSMDLPGFGFVRGDWDLRGREAGYLGSVDVDGRRVLEIGTASGHLCFHMERQGAEVVAFDLAPEHGLDIVPYARADLGQMRAELRDHVQQLNNAFWLSHQAYGSAAKVVYGTTYRIPDAIGPVDIVTLGSVLLHLRDPFLALQSALALTRDTVIVTDRSGGAVYRLPFRLSERLGRSVFFRPDAKSLDPPVTWWRMTPQVVKQMIAVLGFEESTVTYHRQHWRGRRMWMFSVVGRRTSETPVTA